MKAYRTYLALLLATAVGLAAQDNTNPLPGPTPGPAAPIQTPTPTPAPAPVAPAPTTPPPANPLAPEAPATPAPASTPALNVSMPSDQTVTTTVDANGNAADIMHSANFPGVDIRTIITSVAKLFNLNVIVPDTLTGSTTLQLHDVTWKQIFNYVLDPIGYTYVTDGSGPNAVILIKLKTDIASEPMETLVHLLDSAKAEDLAKSLTQFLDTTSKPPETIIPDSRTNSLIITAHPSKMSNILEAINRLDQATKQVYIEAKFIEVNANDDKNLGINWNFDNTPLGSVGYAYQYGVFEGLGALNNSGAMPGNVPEQTINGATASPTPSTNLNFLQPAAGIASNIPTPSRKALDLFLFNQAQYSAVLRALQQITSAKLVSNPTAITLDNKEVTLYSGTNITVVFPTINNQTGQAQAGNNTVYTVGITMKVLPHTTNGGLINLTLNPTLSRIDPVVDTYFGASYPRIDTRSLTNAEVSIKDGFTLAIGGLIDDQDSKATSAVPILSEIPVLGNLFKSTETIHQRNNLIIFVTARTLSAGGAALQETVSSDLMQRANVTADEIPGYYNAKRTVETPGMTYPSKDETKMLDDIQKLRDQAAQLQKMSEYQQKLMEAQSVLEEEKSAQPKGN